jgi:pteridine reductase
MERMRKSRATHPGEAVDLRGSTALVTGGAVRVGRAISIALAGAGARVIIHYNSSAEQAESAVAEIVAAGGQAVALGADLGTMAGVEALIDQAPREFGPIDILVNNASIFPAERFEEVDEELWEATMGINLRAPFFLSRKLGAAMKVEGGGVIVNLADLAGIQSWASYAAHGISKAGLVHLTKVAARALAPEVRVCAIAPGTVLPPENLTSSQIEELAARAPLQRNGSADDVIRALFYLLTADFVTGEVLVVDGGRLLR